MRHITANLTILLSCTVFTGITSAAEDRIYHEEDGIVLFEVEDAEPFEGWQLKTDLADFEGDGYFEWTGPNSLPKNTAGKGTIKYHFRIETAGNYQLRWRSHIALGNENTEHNDSWARLATGQDIVGQHPLDGWTKIYMSTQNEWSWTSKTVDNVGEHIRQYFSEGDHTVEISGRSTGHAIDRIALYRYEDVNYNPELADNWELSRMTMEDGSTVDPEDSEPPVTEPPVEISLDNLIIADDSWQEQLSNQCIGNTLALPATGAATFVPNDASSNFTSAEYLTVEHGESKALLKFDMSLVPPAALAILEYTTNDEASNGTIIHSLGSHSDWQSESDDNVEHPDSMLELSQASGGWEAMERHQSSIPAESLSQDINTIVISSEVESDPITFYAQLTSELTPRLLLTGDDTFCETWQSNIDAANAPEELPEETEEPEESEEAEETPPTDGPEKETDTPKVEETDNGISTGALSWLLMLALACSFNGRRIFRRT